MDRVTESSDMTMIFMASIEHIQKELKRQEPGALFAFFFESTDRALNTAEYPSRALAFVLIDQRKSFTRHIQAKHNCAGKGLFKSQSAFFVTEVPLVVLSIDALDEGDHRQTELLEHIIRQGTDEVQLQDFLPSFCLSIPVLRQDPWPGAVYREAL